MNKPNVILLIGHPLVGKSTWIRENHANTKVISRDDLVLQVSGTDDYNMAFNSVDQDEIDKLLKSKLLEAGMTTEDVIIDMTHISSRRRMKNLRKFPNHNKIAVVFPHLDENEIIRRNQHRLLTEKKSIPLSVVKNMIETFQIPTKEEGFDQIIFL